MTGQRFCLFIVAFILSLSSIKVDAASGRLGMPGNSQERGFFSLSFFGGYEQSRLLNQDGSYSRFKGYNLGAGLDIRIWRSSGGGEVRIFGQGLTASDKGELTSNDELIRNESIYGLKVYANPYVYIAGGLGLESLKFKNGIGEQTLTSKISAVGGGIEFGISDGLFVGLGGWFKSGSLTKFDNPSLSGNSNFESAEGILFLIWSPSSMTVNYLR